MSSITQFLSCVSFPSNIEDSFEPYMYNLPKFKRGPDVIIAGAMKAGTTSLYYWLSQYKDGINAFRHRINTTGKGATHSYTEAKFLHLKQNVRNKELRQLYIAGWPKHKDGLRLEKSPVYLDNAVAAASHIKFMCPNAKVICLFRHPVKRFISHVNHRLRDFFLPEGGGNKIILNSFADLKDWNFSNIFSTKRSIQGFFTKSLYAESFRIFRQALTSSQVHPVIFERMINPVNQEQVLRGVTDFLGLKYQHYELDIQNATENQITIELTEEFREELTSLFDKDVQLLKEYIDDDIPEWNW